MNPNPQDIRKQLSDYEKAGDFCSTFQVNPLNLNQLKSFLFKKPDKHSLLGPLFGNQPKDELQDKK